MNGPVPILLYHSVDAAPAADQYRPWVVTPSLFDEQLGQLAEAGYRVVPLGDLVAARRGSHQLPPGKIVAITFDDGLADFADHALPLLVKHKVPATLFVTSGYVGGRGEWLAPLGEGNRPMLDWDGVRAAEAEGVEIGGHSHTHPMLDLLRKQQVGRRGAPLQGAARGPVGSRHRRVCLSVRLPRPPGPACGLRRRPPVGVHRRPCVVPSRRRHLRAVPRGGA